MDDVLRIALPTYLVVYLIAAFVWRAVAVWRRTGVSPIAIVHSSGAFGAVILAIVAVLAVYGLFPSAAAYLFPIGAFERPWIEWIGLVLLAASLVWTVAAQAQMGASWRVGIDTANKTALVEAGVFGRSRNPIFLGVRVTMLGLFLTVPNAVTLATLVVVEILVQSQVRREERFLFERHGVAYQTYCGRVRRWI